MSDSSPWQKGPDLTGRKDQIAMTHAHEPDTATLPVVRPDSSLAAAAFPDDPFDDDLASELASRASRPVTRTTLALGGLVLVVAGFLGGVLVQKNWGATTSASNGTGTNFPGAFASGFPSGFGNGGGGQGTGRGNATTGTVKLVDGTTIYITTADGQTVTVKTTGTTTVTSEKSAAVKDLKAGASITVQGTAGSNGIITATRVTSTS